jgi:nickel transport protein
VILGTLLLLSPAAFAHRVNIFAWVEGETVFVECRYPDGTRVHGGGVRVRDSAGRELLSGKTDDQGDFSFKVPAPEDLTIVLEAGMGHRAEWQISRQELSPIGTATAGGAAAPDRPAADAPAAPAAMPAPAAAADLEQAIEKALDRKLAPVMRTLAEMREQKVRLTDVLGGLGYIFGLVGVATYFKRKG